MTLDELHILSAVVVGACRHLFGEAVNFGFELSDVAEDLLTFAEDGTPVADLHHLREVADAYALGPTDRALGRLVDARKEFEQSRLASAILPYEGDALFG